MKTSVSMEINRYYAFRIYLICRVKPIKLSKIPLGVIIPIQLHFFSIPFSAHTHTPHQRLFIYYNALYSVIRQKKIKKIILVQTRSKQGNLKVFFFSFKKNIKYNHSQFMYYIDTILYCIIYKVWTIIPNNKITPGKSFTST